jgi:hypothetical protein
MAAIKSIEKFEAPLEWQLNIIAQAFAELSKEGKTR